MIGVFSSNGIRERTAVVQNQVKNSLLCNQALRPSYDEQTSIHLTPAMESSSRCSFWARALDFHVCSLVRRLTPESIDATDPDTERHH